MASRSLDLPLQHGDPRFQLGERKRVEVRLDQRGQAVGDADRRIVLFHIGLFHVGMQR